MDPHDAAAITNELYRYAELIDAGRFTERGFFIDLVGDLSRHLRIELPSSDRHPTNKEHQL